MTNLYDQRFRVDISLGYQILLSVLILLVVAFAAAGAGYWYGRKAVVWTREDPGAIAKSHWQAQGREAMTGQYTSELEAMSVKLGQLQAEVLRLNALGERLVEMADLSQEEFNFDSLPPQGGPTPAEIYPEYADELQSEMDRLILELNDRWQKLSLLDNILMETELRQQSQVLGRPVLSGYVSSYFGYRKDPFHGNKAMHTGVDYAGKMGTPVVAVADGVVVGSGYRDGYGRTVDLQHFNGLATRYGHCQQLLVNQGELVQKGQVIATIGSTGRSTGPHLHFEVLKGGVAINPLRFISTEPANKKSRLVLFPGNAAMALDDDLGQSVIQEAVNAKKQ